MTHVDVWEGEEVREVFRLAEIRDKATKKSDATAVS